MKKTVFGPLLEESFQALTTPGFKVFQTVADAKLGNAVGAESKSCYIEEKQAFYAYLASSRLITDDDLVLTTGDGGNTRWVLEQKVSRSQGDTGWINSSGLALTATTSTNVTLTFPFQSSYAVRSKRYVADNNYGLGCVLGGAAGVKFLYLDDDFLSLKYQDTVWDFTTNVPVAIAEWNGTAITNLWTEFHGIRDTVWHSWAHRYLGTQYNSGLAITTNVQADNNTDPNVDTCQYLWLTSGSIQDEDANITPGVGRWLQTLGSGLTSTTAAILPFFYFNGTIITTIAPMADRTPFIHAGGNTTPQWENAGVLTAATTGQYVVYHYFASPGVDGKSVFARPHNAVFASLITAQSARPSTLTWNNYTEVKHIYSIVFRVNTGWGPVPSHNCKMVSAQDFRSVSGTPGTALSPTSHAGLSGLSDPNVHPAGSIFVDTTNFNRRLSAADNTVQIALDTIDDTGDLMGNWVTSTLYPVDALVKSIQEGWEGTWRCLVSHTSAGSISIDIGTGNWEFLNSERGTRELVNFGAAHGFVVGDVLYTASGVWTKAQADTAAKAEALGVVCGVTTNYFIVAKNGTMTKTGWSLTPDSTYFLSAGTAGALTATPPSVVGQIIKPMISARTADIAEVKIYIGQTVGGTNLYTAIGLANNAATTFHTIQGPAGSGGWISGTIVIDATTDYVIPFFCHFSRQRDGTTYNVSPSFGDTIPAGLSITNSGASVQIVLPNFNSGGTFVSANVTYCVQAAASGTTLPVSVSARSVLGDTSGTAVPAGAIGEAITNVITQTIVASTTTVVTQDTGLICGAGRWELTYSASTNYTTGAAASDRGKVDLWIAEAADNTVVIGKSKRTLYVKTVAAVANDCISCLSCTIVVDVPASTSKNYRLAGIRTDTAGVGQATVLADSTFYAIRIA